MRRTIRQLAAARPGRYLETGSPTGLCGLYTHASPRSALLYTYSATLDKLKEFPESSLYRQSTEALTRHRMAIVQAVEPAGLKEWMDKTQAVLKEHPEVFNTPEGGVDHDGGKYTKVQKNGQYFVEVKAKRDIDELNDEWDGERGEPALEGTRTSEERKQLAVLSQKRPGSEKKIVELDQEPKLTAEQVEELENKIGAGLIEEVIEVAEGELKLTDTLLKAKVWEDLEEKPIEGQWAYFMRDTGTGTTQHPPAK